MNISSLLSGTSASLLGSGTAASQASAAVGSASPFLAQAEQRIQADADVTSAQISKFGLVKSALSDGQVAAKAMEALSSTSTPADVTTALGNFFKTFNASVSSATAAATATGTGSESQRGSRLVHDLKSALSADPAMTDGMHKLGLTIQSDGSLVQDAKKFAAALAADPGGTLAAMAKIGSKVDSVTANELATGGAVGAALATLNAQSTSLKAQQTALRALDQSMAAVSAANPFAATDGSSQSSASASTFSPGLAAYQSNMTRY